MSSKRLYLSDCIVVLGALLDLSGFFFPSFYRQRFPGGKLDSFGYSVPVVLHNAHSLIEVLVYLFPLVPPCALLFRICVQVVQPQRRPYGSWKWFFVLLAIVFLLLLDESTYINVLIRGVLMSTPALHMREVGVLLMLVGTILEQLRLRQKKIETTSIF